MITLCHLWLLKADLCVVFPYTPLSSYLLIMHPALLETCVFIATTPLEEHVAKRCGL